MPVRFRMGLVVGLALASTGAALSQIPQVGIPPQITSVLNAAGAQPKLSRGCLAKITGSAFSGAVAASDAMPLPTSLAGVSVKIGGVAAPILYISGSQIDFQVPYEVPLGSAVSVVVTASSGLSSLPFNIVVADYAVGLFTYPRTAQANDPMIIHGSNGALVTPSSPAQPGETVVAYATGIGKLNQAPATGEAAAAGATSVDTATITVGGAPATVLFAGLAQGSVGVAQFTIQLPGTLATGSSPLVITFPGDVSPTVSLATTQTAPELTVSTFGLAFGTVSVGQSEDQSLTISNTGTANMTIDSVAVTGSGFALVSAAGPFTLLPGGTQTATVRFTASSPGPQSGMLTIASNAPNAPTAPLPLTAIGQIAGADLLSFFLTSVGGTGTDYTPYGNIDTTSYLFSMVVPSTHQWIVADKEASQSYSPNTMYIFGQDSQVYEIVDWDEGSSVSSCNVKRYDPATRQFVKAPTLGGCSLSHIGFIGDSVYYRVPATYDTFHACYCIGGELKLIANGKTTTLLSRTDSDNKATADVADHGTLYAIYHDKNNASLKVWTRNLTTGHLETLVRDYSVNESAFQHWLFKINDGMLYLGVVANDDSSFQIWATDLIVPVDSEGPLQLQAKYPSSAGMNSLLWTVDNGKVAIAYSTATVKDGIAVLDTFTKTTQYYDLGTNAQVYGLALISNLSSANLP